MPAQTRIIHFYVCLGAAGGKECEVIMKNPYCEYQIENTYKNLTENVDYISINHKTYTHIVGLNNYYGSCDIPK